jgi:hypothetical protein
LTGIWLTGILADRHLADRRLAEAWPTGILPTGIWMTCNWPTGIWQKGIWPTFIQQRGILANMHLANKKLSIRHFGMPFYEQSNGRLWVNEDAFLYCVDQMSVGQMLFGQRTRNQQKLMAKSLLVWRNGERLIFNLHVSLGTPL